MSYKLQSFIPRQYDVKVESVEDGVLTIDNQGINPESPAKVTMK